MRDRAKRVDPEKRGADTREATTPHGPRCQCILHRQKKPKK